MDAGRTRELVEGLWDDEIVPRLRDYVAIPNQSPAFDPEWASNGLMERALDVAREWVEQRVPEDASVEVWRLEGRTPLLFVEIPGDVPETVLLYGHLDKQPPMTGWREGLGPYDPVLEQGRLYGRGGADDGYAVFASVTAALALRDQGRSHPRMVLTIECSEESGSPDLPAYIEAYAGRLGEPSLVVCLDSGCGDYERMWLTTSLRGMLVGTLRVRVLDEGVHSGRASGIVPSSFRIARHLLSRLEKPETGAIRPEALRASIPDERVEQARQAVEVLGEGSAAEMPFVEGVRPMSDDPVELLLNRTWRPMLEVTGQEGIPPVEQGGNVLRTHTTLKLSLRLPPTVDGEEAGRRVRELLETDPPHGASVSFEPGTAATGWHAPPLEDWLAEAVDGASRSFFGRPPAYTGEGGTIPFMGMLAERFPKAQFLITGVLGPGSNAHGPNEFLDVPTGKRLTSAVAHVVDAMGGRGG